MKKKTVIVLMLIGLFSTCLFVSAAGDADADGNILELIVVKEWMTDHTVNFENLQFSDTYTAIYFWQQSSAG